MFVKPARRRAQDQFGDESPKQIEAHENIRRKHKRGKPSIALLMLRKLRKFFADRYDRFGPAMPEGDDGALDDFRILVNYTSMLGDPRALQAARERWVPWMSDHDFNVIVADVTARLEHLSPDKLAARIGLFDAKRTELELWPIGSVDVTKEQRIARRKKKKNDARREKRTLDRALRPPPAAQAQPWRAFGKSRRWWYKNGKPMLQKSALNPPPSKLSQRDATSVQALIGC